jgi:hypothetical protein
VIDRSAIRATAIAAVILAVAAGAVAYIRPARSSADWTPTPGPVPAPNSFRITSSPWKLTPDGTWTALVKGHYEDATGADLPLVHAQVSWSASAGETLDQVRWTYSDPATLVTLTQSGPVTVTAKPTNPSNRTATLHLDAPADAAASFTSVARAVGPHLINVGWTPLNASIGVTAYKVYRRESRATVGQLVASLSGNAHA